MSQQLQRKFIILPKDKLSANKLLLLCLKKLEVGQVLSDFFQMSNSVELKFSEFFTESKGYCYIDSLQKRVIINNQRSNNSNQKIFSFKINNKTDVTDELKEKYKPYIFSHKTVISQGISSFSYDVDETTEQIIINDSLKSKISSKLWNLQFYQETMDTVYPFLCYIDSISHPKFVTNIEKVSINQYAKLKKWINFLDNNPGLPKRENVNRIVSIILENRDNLIELNNIETGFTAKSSMYSIDFIKMVKDIGFRLKIGPFSMFNDSKLDRFKHMFHPGLYLFVRFLEVTNNLENFELMLQKQIFKCV